MSNAYDVVELFERRVAEFAGAPHAVAVDCCTNALFLACKYYRVGDVRIPSRTYISVGMAIIHAGGRPVFEDREWSGTYRLDPYPIVDGAKRFRSGMYEQDTLHCLSMHLKKHINIGRGGMILTDNSDAADWLRRARYDGREGKPYTEERVTSLGWHFYMTPEQAARGLALLDVLPPDLPDLQEQYPDLRTQPIFEEWATR